jgi:hypothetical protein
MLLLRKVTVIHLSAEHRALAERIDRALRYTLAVPLALAGVLIIIAGVVIVLSALVPMGIAKWLIDDGSPNDQQGSTRPRRRSDA